MTIYNVLLGLGSISFNFNRTITANTADYNLYNDAISNGWDGTTPLSATITINGCSLCT